MHTLERTHRRLDSVVDAGVGRQDQTVAREYRGERYLDRGRAKPITRAAVRAAAEHRKFERSRGSREPSFGSKHIPVGKGVHHPIGKECVKNDARALRQWIAQNFVSRWATRI